MYLPLNLGLSLSINISLEFLPVIARASILKITNTTAHLIENECFDKGRTETKLTLLALIKFLENIDLIDNLESI